MTSSAVCEGVATAETLATDGGGLEVADGPEGCVRDFSAKIMSSFRVYCCDAIVYCKSPPLPPVGVTSACFAEAVRGGGATLAFFAVVVDFRPFPGGATFRFVVVAARGVV